MRVTIIPDDGFVSVDGEGFLDIDLSSMPANVHAVQWYHTEGEVEYRDARGRATHNEAITDITQYHFALELWQAAKTEHEAREAARAEAEAAAKAATSTTQTPPVAG